MERKELEQRLLKTCQDLPIEKVLELVLWADSLHERHGLFIHKEKNIIYTSIETFNQTARKKRIEQRQVKQ